jgi:hypothetical protein
MKDVVRFLEEKKLKSIAILFVNGIKPFRRVFFFAVSVTNPLFALVFGPRKAGELELFFSKDTSFELLKRYLERERP